MILEERQLLSIFDRAAILAQTSPLSRGSTVATSVQSTTPKSISPIDLYRLSDDLVDLYATDVLGMTVPKSANGFAPVLVPMLRDPSGRVAIDITTSNVDTLAPALENLGFVTTTIAADHHLIEGYLPTNRLKDITTLTSFGLTGVQGIAKPMTSAGSTLAESDFTLQASRTRATSPPGVTGSGVTIGVLSDSYNNKGGAATGIANGDLPSSLVFNRDLSSGGSDEGRGMMEIVQDLAPGSPKAFATAFTGEAGFAQNIRDLAKSVAAGGAGAKVIVDDIFYFAEPMFQDGIVAQAVDDVVTNQGVSYFSSAGNLQDQSYENASPVFATTTISSISSTPAKYLQFSPGVFAQNITVSAQQFLAGLQWSDPFYTVGGVKSNLDLFLITSAGIISSSISNNIATNTPYEQAAASGSGTFQVVIRLTAGADPTRVKWVNFGSNSYGPVTIQFPTNSSTITPHSASVNAMSVAASPFYDQKNVESFSSKGPSTNLFTPTGVAVAATSRAKPDILATDGVSTSFFGQFNPTIGHYLFFGTSAAAPNAAAVAALVIQANPSFTPAQVYNRLTSTADSAVNGGVTRVGAGLVDAYRAVVGQPTVATTPVNDGFETGALPQNWDAWNSGSGRITVSTANTPSAGVDHLILDSDLPTGFSLGGLSEAILHVNLAGKTGVKLGYASKRFTSESITSMPASFLGHSNTDGVALSVDGISWFRISNLSTITTSYQTTVLDLSAIAFAAGLSLSSDTRIKFQRFQSVSGQAPANGIAFDSVSVTTETVVSNVTSTVADGSYGTGSVIDVTVAFSAPVFVTGTPQLALTVAGPPAVANYLSGSGTSTLTFRYIVSAGQSTSDLDYSSTSALTLNGGTILDGATAPATLTLPTPGTAGSLGANKNIVIDAIAPVVLQYNVGFGSKTYNLVGAARTNLPWQISGLKVVFSKPITTGDINSLTGLAATSFSGLGTNTLTFALTPILAGSFITKLQGTGSSALKDNLGNALSDGTGFSQNFKVLYGDYNGDGVVNSSDMLQVYGAIGSSYDIFADLNGDGLVDINDYQIVRKRIGAKL